MENTGSQSDLKYRLKPEKGNNTPLNQSHPSACYRLEPVLQIALTSSVFHLVPSNARSMGGLIIQMKCQTFSVELFDLRCGSPAACVSGPWPDQLVQCIFNPALCPVRCHDATSTPRVDDA